MSPEAKQMLAMGQAMGLLDEHGRPNLANLAKLTPQEREMLSEARKSGMLTGLGFGPSYTPPSTGAAQSSSPPNLRASPGMGMPASTSDPVQMQAQMHQQAQIQAAQLQHQQRTNEVQQHEQLLFDHERDRMVEEAELAKFQKELLEKNKTDLLRKAAGHGPGTEDMERMVGKYFQVDNLTQRY